jgi:hypothetical protein
MGQGAKRCLQVGLLSREMNNSHMSMLFSLLALGIYQAQAAGLPVVDNLRAGVRSGQIFLTWDELPVEDGATFEVFIHTDPIRSDNLSQARRVGHHIEPGSACDWWKDPSSFDADADPDRTHGFVIEGRELDPQSGLFVHTVSEPNRPAYFAVLPAGASPSDVLPGRNSLKDPVVAEPAMPQPIRLQAAPDRQSGAGKSLTLVLHGRGDGRDADGRANFVVFGDGSQGWRPGLARKFVVESDDEGIVIHPLDRTWIGRPLLYSRDKRDHVPAINTWWYGCNDKIYDPSSATSGVVVNYTEEHLLYLVRWAQDYFGTDPARTYIRGKSMGGSGAITVGFNHPDVFAAVYSDVPIVAYTSRAGSDGKSNLWRLDGICGRPCDETIMSSDGIPLVERMNSERVAREYSGDLPFLLISNGRNDGSIPWINNPSFYRALNESRRGFVAYWNDGKHDMGDFLPEDIGDFYSLQPGIRLEASYPAFSNFSANSDPGNGEVKNGDTIGWMNRGLYWSDLRETGNSWSIRISVMGDFLPDKGTVDVTPRRLSKLKIQPGQVLLANGHPVQADERGLVTVTGVPWEKDKPIHLTVSSLPETASRSDGETASQ